MTKYYLASLSIYYSYFLWAIWLFLVLLGFCLAYLLAKSRLRAIHEKELENQKNTLEEVHQAEVKSLRESKEGVQKPLFPYENKPLIDVKNRKFTNEQVVLDGHSFSDCTFTNVSFVYNGTNKFDFQHNTVKGNVLIKSENRAVTHTIEFLKGWGFMKDNVPVLDQDEQPLKHLESPIYEKGGIKSEPQEALPDEIKLNSENRSALAEKIRLSVFKELESILILSNPNAMVLLKKNPRISIEVTAGERTRLKKIENELLDNRIIKFQSNGNMLANREDAQMRTGFVVDKLENFDKCINKISE